jgi:uncharacterized OsmC-like protein
MSSRSRKEGKPVSAEGGTSGEALGEPPAHCEWCGAEYPAPVSHPVSAPHMEALGGAPPSAAPSVYVVEGHSIAPGRAHIHAKGAPIEIDSAPRLGGELPGPADLLAGAFAACMLKNVERFAQILRFGQEGATVRVTIERQETPPRFSRIEYELRVRTDEDAARVDLLHRNLQRHGTVFNTLGAVCEVSGTIVAEATHPAD